jgi:signal transduction histidine kinase
VVQVSSIARRRGVLLVALLTVVVLVAGSTMPLLIAPVVVEQVESVLRHLQTAILFGAASLGLLSGRWSARTSVGFACGALLVLAFAAAVSATSAGQAGLFPVMTTGGAALAVLLLLAAAAAPEVHDATSLRRLLTRESGPVALLALLALTPVVAAVLVAGAAMPASVRIVLSGLVAAGWLVAGAQVFRLDPPRLGWLPAVVLILAVAAVVRAFVGGAWSGSYLVALGLEALAGTLAFVGAAMAARSALASTTAGMTSMLQDLSALQDNDRRRLAEESERLHEIRSVLAGLRAATGSLRKYEDSLDPGVRRRLEDAVGAELNRLNHLVDPGVPEVTEELVLDLESAVKSVVVAEREQGLVVTTDITDVYVRGQAAEIATLVSDLLVNARVPAPGSVVRLSSRVDGEVATLEVRDWGPGLSASEAVHVFDRSFRGARPIALGVPGSGLGLHNARRLARQMHGDLQLRAPAGGGACFVATFPVARNGVDEAASARQVLQALEADWSADQSVVVETVPRRCVQASQHDPRPR